MFALVKLRDLKIAACLFVLQRPDHLLRFGHTRVGGIQRDEIRERGNGLRRGVLVVLGGGCLVVIGEGLFIERVGGDLRPVVVAVGGFFVSFHGFRIILLL